MACSFSLALLRINSHHKLLQKIVCTNSLCEKGSRFRQGGSMSSKQMRNWRPWWCPMPETLGSLLGHLQAAQSALNQRGANRGPTEWSWGPRGSWGWKRCSEIPLVARLCRRSLWQASGQSLWTSAFWSILWDASERPQSCVPAEHLKSCAR